MHFVLTKGTDKEDPSEFAYAACAYACVASENQALITSQKNVSVYLTVTKFDSGLLILAYMVHLDIC